MSESVGRSVCDHDPGFDVDVVVRCDLSVLYRLWYHQQPIAFAVKGGELRFDGVPALVRRMSKVLDLRPAAELGVDAFSRRPVWLS